jgi:ubiquinone/menaquinone biosynthesis C-methylase UbiE
MDNISIKLFLEYNMAVAMLILKNSDPGNFRVKRVYESENFVVEYYTDTSLQKPESTILEELRNELPNMKMLDIGVGPGRTIKHFAGLTKEYIGVDYSNAMIKASRLKFPQYRLEVADARHLSAFEDAYFDFVLFSLNGIDSVEHEDRQVILREIRRVLKKDGYFCFSTLNLNSWKLRPVFKFSKNPATLCKSAYNFLLNNKLWRTVKPPITKTQHMMAYYTYKDFLFRNYFVTPSEIIKQLSDAGFSRTKAYDLQSGKEVKDPSTMLDYWVYFLTRAN